MALPTGVRGGDRRCVEAAADVLIDGECGAGCAGGHVAAERVPALPLGAADDAGVVGEPADLHRAVPRPEVGKDLDLDALAAGGRFVPRAGQPVLIEVERGRRSRHRSEGKIAHQILAGQADLCADTGRRVDREHPRLIAVPPKMTPSVGRTARL